MAPSIDTYLQNQLTTTLNQFLGDPTLLKKQILNNFNADVSDSFVNTFGQTTDCQQVEIPIVMEYNPTKPAPRATILIQEKGGQESEASLGLENGGGLNNTDELVTEELPLQYDEEQQIGYFAPSQPVQNVISITNYQGPTQIENNKIYLKDSMSGTVAQQQKTPQSSRIVYERTKLPAEPPLHDTHLQGFNANEAYTLELLSSNIDTIRCLSTLVKMALFTMRITTQAESYNLRLSQLSWESIDLLDPQNNAFDSTFGNQTYHKRVNVQFQTSYNLEMTMGKVMTDFKLADGEGGFQDVK